VARSAFAPVLLHFRANLLHILVRARKSHSCAKGLVRPAELEALRAWETTGLAAERNSPCFNTQRLTVALYQEV